MHFQLLRHATLVLTIKGQKLLVDPMLSPAGAMDPVANAADTRRIPLVDLPLSEAELAQLIGQLTGVLVTHTHRDHWDSRAIEVLPKHLPILCQPPDEARIRDAGFTNVTAIQTEVVWNGIHLHRTGGQHGTGEIGQKMGPVSGYILEAEGEHILYIAGDTIWCAEVATALANYSPQIVVVNAGAAQFLTGGSITMTAEDVKEVCRAARSAQVVAVHMETVNHCGLTRADLRQALLPTGFADQVWTPADGATLTL